MLFFGGFILEIEENHTDFEPLTRIIMSPHSSIINMLNTKRFRYTAITVQMVRRRKNSNRKIAYKRWRRRGEKSENDGTRGKI